MLKDLKIFFDNKIYKFLFKIFLKIHNPNDHPHDHAHDHVHAHDHAHDHVTLTSRERKRKNCCNITY